MPSLAPRAKSSEAVSMDTSSTAPLPEEILERIIDLAIPQSVSTIRCGRGTCGHQSFFRASKQMSRIANDIYFRRPVKVYVTDPSYICDKSYSGYSWWSRCCQPIPWASFTRINIHVHPELSFLSLHHTDQDVTVSRGPGILDNVQSLAEALKFSSARQMISKGWIDLTIQIHNACPSHDPVSYADLSSLPAHHVPIWEYNKVDCVIAQFAWTNR